MRGLQRNPARRSLNENNEAECSDRARPNIIFNTRPFVARTCPASVHFPLGRMRCAWNIPRISVDETVRQKSVLREWVGQSIFSTFRWRGMCWTYGRTSRWALRAVHPQPRVLISNGCSRREPRYYFSNIIIIVSWMARSGIGPYLFPKPVPTN